MSAELLRLLLDTQAPEPWMLEKLKAIMFEYRLSDQRHKETVVSLFKQAVVLFPGNFDILSFLVIDLGQVAYYTEGLRACKTSLADFARASGNFVDAALLSDASYKEWRGVVILGLKGDRRFKMEEVKPLASLLGQQPLLEQLLTSMIFWVCQRGNALSLHFALLLGLALPQAHRSRGLSFVTSLLAAAKLEFPDDAAVWSNLCAQLNDHPSPVEGVALEMTSLISWLKNPPELKRCEIPKQPYITQRYGVYRLGEYFFDEKPPPSPTKPPVTPSRPSLPSIAELKTKLDSLQKLQPGSGKVKPVNLNGFIVLDTNILMGGMEWIEELSRPMRLVIPLAVFAELNALLSRPEKEARAKEAFDFLLSPGKLVTISYLHSDGTLLDTPSAEEVVMSPSIRNSDDVILMACLLLRNTQQDVCLVSDDLNVQLKGEAMQLTVLSRRSLIALFC